MSERAFLLPLLLSESEVLMLRQEIESLKRQLFSNDTHHDVGQLLSKILSGESLASLSPEECSDAVTIDRLLPELTDRDEMRILLAVRPSAAFVHKLEAWAIQHVKAPTTLLVERRPEILAGIIIEWQGRVYDYSSSKLLRKFLERFNNSI